MNFYVGTPYVFAAIKGEEDASGKGSTLTIKKNQLKVVKEGNYSKPDGTSGKSDGVVLPEKSKIVIEEGGILSIEGNFLNNGTIINNGGTIIVKDGGCISPFGDTNEGKIKCVGGDIIVMPGGKMFCLVDGAGSGDKSTDSDPALDLLSSDKGPSSLTNYGLVVLTRCEAAEGNTIENRKDGKLLTIYKRTDSSVLLNDAEVEGSGDDITITGLSKFSAGYGVEYNGSIRGAVAGTTPTVINEQTATLVYNVPEVHVVIVEKTETTSKRTEYNIPGRDYSKAKDGSGGFTIITPEY